jgi:hypothetical protein
MKYRKKPVVIEAVQFTRRFDWPEWFHDAVSEDRIRVHNTGKFQDWTAPCWAMIATMEGDMKVSENDWVIKGVKGELYPCKPDIFEATYEMVES